MRWKSSRAELASALIATQLGIPVAVSSNQATFSTNQLKIGKHSFRAVYNGDSNFNASPQSPAVVQYKSPRPR